MGEQCNAYLGFTFLVAGILAGCKRRRKNVCVLSSLSILLTSPNSQSLRTSGLREVFHLDTLDTTPSATECGVDGHGVQEPSHLCSVSNGPDGAGGDSGAVTNTLAFPGVQAAESGP